MKSHCVAAVLTTVAVVAVLCCPPAVLAAETRLIAEFQFQPGESEVTFNLPTAAESYPIQVRNGEARGKDRVSSAVIAVNGKELFTQKNFNQNVGSLSTSLPKGGLKVGENTVSVRINGRPGAYLVVSVYGIYPTPTVVRYYRDYDRDGYGAPSPVLMLPASASTPPVPVTLGQPLFNWVTKGGDCNDANRMVYPGNGCAPLP